jgi:hypothetical protein
MKHAFSRRSPKPSSRLRHAEEASRAERHELEARAARARCGWASGLLAAALAAAACEDPLTDPALIAGPRIVGARVSDAADPAVAAPSAGASARIDWLVLSDRAGEFSASVAWCSAAPSVLGAPRCGGPVFLEQRVAGRFGESLSLDFTLPGALAPGAAWLSWLGLCDTGEPSFDPDESLFHCSDGQPTSGFYRGFIPEGSPNRNPSLADDTLLLDGAVWAEPTDTEGAPDPGAPCRASVLPELSTRQASSIAFELGGDDREALEDARGTYAAHDRESLVYTHVSNRSGLERAFSAIDFDADELRFEVPFAPEGEDPPSDGATLSVYLLVRDERGGVDWSRRDACLLPP